jgi:serine/threonine-protein kinase
MKNPYPLMRLSGSRIRTLRGTLARDRFALVKPLAQGRFGSCFLVSRDTSDFVLKVFNPNDVKRRKEKLTRESKYLKRIDHPAIPKLIQVLDRDGFYGLVMEQMPGQSLADLLDWDHSFSKAEITAIMAQLIAVMDYLAGLNISHRDIKTDNILWTGAQLALIDFGTSSAMSRCNSRFNPDFWGLGDVFLRLAANCDEMTTSSNDFSLAQLDVKPAQRCVIQRLLYIDKPYQDFQSVIKDFNHAWLKNTD